MTNSSPMLPQRKSFALTAEDFDNLNQVAESYDVSESKVIRVALRNFFREHGLRVMEDDGWYFKEPDALTDTDSLRRIIRAVVQEMTDGTY